MGKYFGTDGFRGEANVKLNVEHAYKIGRYLGWYFAKKKTGKIVIGKDTRRSSYMFEYALASGIVASGSDAYLLHVTTTPSIAYTIQTGDFDCGIMITASHNVFSDNGIKILDNNGKKLSPEIEDRIEKYIDGIGENIGFAKGTNIGRTIDYSIGRNRYIGYLISIATKSFKGIRVGLDLANGSASSIARNVFEALGAKTYVINDKPDGTNINNECGSTHIEKLQQFVLDKELDIGFAYDGDADRCLAVDKNGKLVDGDLILYICGKYLKKQNRLNKDTVVTTVMSNIGLYKAFDNIGIKYVKTDVGDKYVFEEMQKNDYTLGGEQSGHIIFSQFATTGDGILTSLMMMEVLLEQDITLDEAIRDVIIYPQTLENVRVKDKTLAMENQQVQNIIKNCEEEINGEGRILVRKSGTEPVVRIMVEAKSKTLCTKYVSDILAVMEEEDLII